MCAGVKSSFQGSLQRKAWYSRWSYPQSYNTWRDLANIEASFGSDVSQESVKNLHTVLQTVECWELRSYHAVATLYEKIATFMVCGGVSDSEFE